MSTHAHSLQTQEFADRMRVIVREKLPTLSSKLHRPTVDADHTATLWNSPTSAGGKPHLSASDDTAEWTWPDAEKRLSAAYESSGFSGWAQAAMEELEAEGRSERRKRSQS